MARVIMTARYSGLESWPGRLFEAEDPFFNVVSSTNLNWEHSGSSPFAGYEVRISGTGFAFDGMNVPTAGTISAVKVYDPDGNLVLTIDQFSGTGISRDLPQIFSDMFGWQQEDGIGPDGKMAWSHLLLGNDTIIGTAGDDNQALAGFMDGNDRLEMKGGDDYIWCGGGRDTVNGGAGFDTLSYSETAFNEGFSAFRGINVNMVQKTVTDCWGFTDKIIGVEAVYGSRFNDTFLGSDANDEFAGSRGRDVLNGGKGRDLAVYYDEEHLGGTRGITVDLQTSITKGVIKGFAIDSFGQRDTLISMEDIFATSYDDRLIGSKADNRIQGRVGDDTMTGSGGQDEFYWRSADEIGNDDVITDFAASGSGRDVLQFNTGRFDNMATTLTLVNGSAATAAVGTFIFDAGTLYWDEDGTGGIGRIKIVELQGVAALTAANFDLF